MHATLPLRYIDPLDLPTASLTALLQDHAEGVFVDNTTPRQFMRQPPVFIDDPDQTGLFAGLGAAEVHYPPLFTVAARDVLLTGYRTSVLPNGEFFTDDSLQGPQRETFLNHLRQDNVFLNESTGLFPMPDKDSFQLRDDRGTLPLKGAVIVLSSSEPLNYGSFLFRILPKLASIRAYPALDAHLLAPRPAPSCDTLLQLCGVPAERIITQDPTRRYRIERAIIPSLRNNQAYLDPQTIQMFARLRDRWATPQSQHTALCLYISRLHHSQRGASTRVMTNEAELITRLRTMGFQILYPENTSPQEQIAAFGNAELIVGPSGSAMFNVAFCRPGTKLIDIESEPHWIHAHACLFSSCQLRFGLFVGRSDPSDPNPVHKRWSVNIEALLDRIQSFLHA